jgi:hypothetical protein
MTEQRSKNHQEGRNSLPDDLKPSSTRWCRTTSSPLSSETVGGNLKRTHPAAEI